MQKNRTCLLKLLTNQIDIQAQISTTSKNHIMNIFTLCVFAVSLRHYNWDGCHVDFYFCKTFNILLYDGTGNFAPVCFHVFPHLCTVAKSGLITCELTWLKFCNRQSM